MFGELIEKDCTNCEKKVQQRVSLLYWVEQKEYVNSFNCPICQTDLAAEDRAAIQQARAEGKTVSVVMA